MKFVQKKEDDTELQNKHDLYQIMWFVYKVITCKNVYMVI